MAVHSTPALCVRVKRRLLGPCPSGGGLALLALDAARPGRDLAPDRPTVITLFLWAGTRGLEARTRTPNARTRWLDRQAHPYGCICTPAWR
jgi:hypothetical protein